MDVFSILGSFLDLFSIDKNVEIDRFKQFGDFPVAPSDSTRRDASNGGIIVSNGHNFGHLRTKHRFRFLELLIKNRIFIEKQHFHGIRIKWRSDSDPSHRKDSDGQVIGPYRLHQAIKTLFNVFSYHKITCIYIYICV